MRIEGLADSKEWPEKYGGPGELLYIYTAGLELRMPYKFPKIKIKNLECLAHT